MAPSPPPSPPENGEPTNGSLVPMYIVVGIVGTICLCGLFLLLAWSTDECDEDETPEECEERRRAGLLWFLGARARDAPSRVRERRAARTPLLGKAKRG